MRTIICNRDSILEQVEDYFSSFSFIFDKLFNDKSDNINALIILEKLKEKKIDIYKLENFIMSLPEERWTIELIENKINEINDIFGITNEEIKVHCVNEVRDKDIINIKWDLSVLSLLESSRYSNEYYDSLKYNQSANLSLIKIKLLNELMLVFKFLKESSSASYEKFKNRKYSKKNIGLLNPRLFQIDLLWMRVLYVLFNLKDTDNNKTEKLIKVLSEDRISLSHQKIISQKYN